MNQNTQTSMSKEIEQLPDSPQSPSEDGADVEITNSIQRGEYTSTNCKYKQIVCPVEFGLKCVMSCV